MNLDSLLIPRNLSFTGISKFRALGDGVLLHPAFNKKEEKR